MSANIFFEGASKLLEYVFVMGQSKWLNANQRKKPTLRCTSQLVNGTT
jgi:hypothetical protein